LIHVIEVVRLSSYRSHELILRHVGVGAEVDLLELGSYHALELGVLSKGRWWRQARASGGRFYNSSRTANRGRYSIRGQRFGGRNLNRGFFRHRIRDNGRSHCANLGRILLD